MRKGLVPHSPSPSQKLHGRASKQFGALSVKLPPSASATAPHSEAETGVSIPHPVGAVVGTADGAGCEGMAVGAAVGVDVDS